MLVDSQLELNNIVDSINRVVNSLEGLITAVTARYSSALHLDNAFSTIRSIGCSRLTISYRISPYQGLFLLVPLPLERFKTLNFTCGGIQVKTIQNEIILPIIQFIHIFLLRCAYKDFNCVCLLLSFLLVLPYIFPYSRSPRRHSIASMRIHPILSYKFCRLSFINLL